MAKELKLNELNEYQKEKLKLINSLFDTHIKKLDKIISENNINIYTLKEDAPELYEKIRKYQRAMDIAWNQLNVDMFMRAINLIEKRLKEYAEKRNKKSIDFL